MKRARQPAGYVLLAVVLLTALIATLVMTYSRHALLAADTSLDNTATQQAQAATDTGFAWAKQSLYADAGPGRHLDLGDGREITVSVNSASDTLRSIGVQATTEGRSQSMQATFEVYSMVGEDLPELTPNAKRAVTTSPLLIPVHGNKSYSNTELTGILYLHNGAKLTLQDVILDGAIVTEQATGGVGGNVEINLRGGVQIVPGSTLPGCAIIAPDATVVGNGSERVQIHGVIVAYSISITGSGAVHGELACARNLVLSGALDRPGIGRAPRAWPSSLVTNASGVGRLVFAGSDVADAERTAIRAFTFPARRSGSGTSSSPGP